MDDAKLGIKLLSSALNAAPIPEPFKSAVTAIPDLVITIMDIVERVKRNVDDAAALVLHIADVTMVVMRPFGTGPQNSLDENPVLKLRINEFKAVLEEIKEDMSTLMSRRLLNRVFTSVTDTSKLAEMKERVGGAIHRLQLETVVATGHGVDIIGQKQDAAIQQQYAMSQRVYALIQKQDDAENRRLIDLLGDRDPGVNKKRPCLDGTRSALLDRITQWIEMPLAGSRTCFFLLGVAGSGKSSIAASIANRERKEQRLGGQFHFTRDEQARNRGAVLALSQQMASWQSGMLRSAIASAIRDEPKMAHMTTDYQFQKLIQEPLETLDITSPILVIVLDALDECDIDYASSILRLISKGLAKLPATIKFFIASGAEPHLQYYFEKDPMRSRLKICDLGNESQEAERDIETYLKEELPEMVGPLLKNPSSDWPGEKKRQALVHKSQGLFIYATTAARILSDHNSRDPEKALERLLSSDTHAHLDGIYRQVMDRACPRTIEDDVLALFQSVLGALVIAQEPVNIYTLASLLCSDNLHHREFSDRLRVQVLRYLQAVLTVPGVDISEPAQDEHPIRFIHTSFVDYLTDQSRCDRRFRISVAEQHEQMAIRCFRQMQGLKRNICNLDPSLLNSEVEDLDKRMREYMPPGLRYACAHVTAHISQTSTGSTDVEALVTMFVETRLMTWLEALSLMGKTHDSVGMVVLVESWLKSKLGQSPLPLTKSPPPVDLIDSFTRFIMPSSTTSIPARSAQTTSGALFLRILPLLYPFIADTLPPATTAVPSATNIELMGSYSLTLALLDDFKRFVMEFMDPITASSTHIHYSALPFTPTRTALSRVYSHSVRDGPKVIRGHREQWPQTLWTATKHSGAVSCLLIAAGGRTVISGSIDHTVRSWDANTGAPIGEALKGHTDAIKCLAISPDGKTIISGSDDNTARLWDASTGAPVGEVLKGHMRAVRCLAISPNGKTVVSGSDDHTVRLWDASTGVPFGEALIGHTRAVRCLAVSFDGRTVVSGSNDCTVRLWDVGTRAPFGEALKGHTRAVRCLAISPDGMTIISGSIDHTVRLWHASIGVSTVALEGHMAAVRCLTVSPDGKTVISGSDDCSVRLWDTSTGAPVGGILKGHTRAVRCLAISPNGKTIVSGSIDSTVRVWDASTGAPIGAILEGHTGAVNCLAISPDCKTVISGSNDCTVRLWDASTQTPGGALEGHTHLVSSLTISPDGKTVISGSDDHTLRLWDANSGAPIGEAVKGHMDVITCLAISPNGESIVSGSSDCTVRLWNASTGAPIGEVLECHTKGIWCLVISPDGKTVVSGSNDGTIRFWDAVTAAPIGRALKGCMDAIWCLAISRDGRTIVSGSEDGTIRLWDASTGAPIGEALEAHAGGITCLIVSSDGNTIISGSSDCTVRWWDVRNGVPIGEALKGHTHAVRCLVMSPDGKTVISGSEDNTIRLWDASTRAPIGEVLKCHTDGVICLAISPDGKTIISGSGDRTIRLWDYGTGAPIGEALKGHEDTIWCLAISPDGKTIISGSDDDTIRLWDVSTRAPIGEILDHTDGVMCLAISPDGNTIISGSDDCMMHWWDVSSGVPIRESLTGHTGAVRCLAISPDNKTVISGSDDWTLRSWDAIAGAPVGEALEGHMDAVTCLAISPDGGTIISGSGDRTVRLWNASTRATTGQPIRISNSAIISIIFSPDGKLFFVNQTSNRGPPTITLWDTACQLRVTDTHLLQVTHVLNPPIHSFTFNEHGWVSGPNGKALFWLPHELRGQLATLSTGLLGVKTKKVLLIDTSAHVS